MQIHWNNWRWRRHDRIDGRIWKKRDKWNRWNFKLNGKLEWKLEESACSEGKTSLFCISGFSEETMIYSANAFAFRVRGQEIMNFVIRPGMVGVEGDGEARGAVGLMVNLFEPNADLPAPNNTDSIIRMDRPVPFNSLYYWRGPLCLIASAININLTFDKIEASQMPSHRNVINFKSDMFCCNAFAACSICRK